MARKGLPKWAIKEAKRRGAKNIFAYAWTLVKRKKKPGTRRRTSRTRRSNPKRRVKRRMARRKRCGGGKSLQRTIFKWIRVGALVAPGVGMGVNAAKKGWGAEGVIDQVLQCYTGYSFIHRKFDMKWLVTGWGPFLAATLATYGIPKIAGILRKL